MLNLSDTAVMPVLAAIAVGVLAYVFDTLRPVGYRRRPTLPMGFGG